jgi:phosphoglycerate dehydrogenase-like enzyme
MKVVYNASLGKAQLQKRLAEMIGDRAVWVDDAAVAGRELADADALICPDHFIPKVIDAVRAAPNLRWVQLVTAGYDHIKTLGVPERITVCNAGEAYAPAVATHAIALLLALQRRLPDARAGQARHEWSKPYAAHASIPAFNTAVVIGFGPIGREIARLLRAFGATVIAVSRHGRPHAMADETVAADRLHDVLPRADAIVIAAPFDATTRRLIDARALAACKPTAILVNIARGGIVDQAALAAALRGGALAGAGLDVTEPEPLPPDDPLWDCPNLIITPHYAGASGPRAGERIADIAGGNLRRFLDGAPLQHLVPMRTGD